MFGLKLKKINFGLIGDQNYNSPISAYLQTKMDSLY